MGFGFVQKSVTLNNFEPRNGRYLYLALYRQIVYLCGQSRHNG